MLVMSGVVPSAAKVIVVGPATVVPSPTVTSQVVGEVLVNWADSWTGLPCASYPVSVVVIGLVLVVSAGRLPAIFRFFVAAGWSRVPIGSLMSVGLTFVLVTPLVAFRPGTVMPSGLT